MTQFDLFHDLRSALANRKTAIAAVGIDLGTTKSCTAIARFDPADGQITCACVAYPEPGIPGMPVAVPSVVAVKDGEISIGHAARRLVGRKGYTPLRNVFRECKNDMGLRYTYWKAPEGFRSATDIAGHLTGHLVDAGGLAGQGMQAPLIVTVPASFHGAQRSATIAATQRHVHVENSVQLLDEPYAAFLDLLHQQPDLTASALMRDANVLVFDFGGGTCDVAIFTLATKGQVLMPRLLATSRYHRIGGGDIDRALVHGHLLPMLFERHGLSSKDISWQDKRSKLEPQLLPLAERLKLALCRRMTERVAGEGANADKGEEIEVVAAGEYEITLDESSYFLESPTLTSTTFVKLIAPFLDTVPAPEGDNDEYVQRGSIFSPVLQALQQARLDVEDISAIVLAGSSTLIPQVRTALRNYFPEAALLTWPDGTELQGAIARGAALQALSLAATGQPLLAPVCSGDLGVQTRQGFLPLVTAGSELPQSCESPIPLQVPEDSPHQGIDISVEVLAEGKRLLGRSLWHLPPPVRAGEALSLSWSLDENQCLALELQRPGHEGTEPFQQRFDAPVAHLDLGQVVRCRMLEREEAIRNDRVIRADLGEAYTAIARDAAALGEHDKALHFVALAMQEQGSTPYLMNLKGLYRERVGDSNTAEQCYRQADSLASQFNLALLHFNQERFDETLAGLDRLMTMDKKRAYSVLKAQAIEGLGRPQEARLHYQDALNGNIDLPECEEWELYWLARAARQMQSTEHQRVIEAEMKAQQQRRVTFQREGYLPDQQAPGAQAGSRREEEAA